MSSFVFLLFRAMLLAPRHKGLDLLIVIDEAHHRCVTNLIMGLEPCTTNRCAVIGEDGVEKRTEQRALRDAGVKAGVVW